MPISIDRDHFFTGQGALSALYLPYKRESATPGIRIGLTGPDEPMLHCFVHFGEGRLCLNGVDRGHLAAFETSDQRKVRAGKFALGLPHLKDNVASLLGVHGDDGIGQALKSRLAISLCQPSTGPEGDGVVYYHYQDHGIDFEIFNKDGSLAEISGNGMAGLSAVIFSLNPGKSSVTLNTQVGEKTHQLLSRNGDDYRLKIEIGVANFNATNFFPFLTSGKIEYLFGEKLLFYPVSVGNPHVVILWKEKFLLG